jgi:cytidylate kinase
MTNKCENNIIITIDGETASGKTTVSNRLAEYLGYKHIDGGAIFRSLGYLMDFYQLDLSSMLQSLLNEKILQELSFVSERVFFRKVEITTNIHSETSGLRAADLGKNEAFQKWFVCYLRSVVASSNSNCILSGRIGGSYIFPRANHKIYLIAKLEMKQNRRYSQLSINQEKSFSFDETRQSILYRDNIKSIIPYWKVTIPPDTHFLNTSFLTIDQVSEAIASTIR